MGKQVREILNVFSMNLLGLVQVLCPFPCSVFVMYPVRTSPTAPNER
jgi:hypothetical protein